MWQKGIGLRDSRVWQSAQFVCVCRLSATMNLWLVSWGSASSSLILPRASWSIEVGRGGWELLSFCDWQRVVFCYLTFATSLLALSTWLIRGIYFASTCHWWPEKKGVLPLGNWDHKGKFVMETLPSSTSYSYCPFLGFPSTTVNISIFQLPPNLTI